MGIHYLPQAGNLYIDILIRSGLFILLYAPVVYFSKVAPDLMKMVEDKIKLFRGKSSVR
jgi:hypothetical protein